MHWDSALFFARRASMSAGMRAFAMQLSQVQIL
jgi:hypothetical protein